MLLGELDEANVATPLGWSPVLGKALEDLACGRLECAALAMRVGLLLESMELLPQRDPPGPPAVARVQVDVDREDARLGPPLDEATKQLYPCLLYTSDAADE